MGVVAPRRPVHERVERVAIDDEIAFTSDQKDLAASPWKVPARERLQPRLPRRRARIRRLRWTLRGSAPAANRAAQDDEQQTQAENGGVRQCQNLHDVVERLHQ